MTKLFERLLSRPVFRLDEAVAIMPEWVPETVYKRLADLVRQGRVGRVGLGVYFVVRPGQRPETTVVDPYLVGSRLASDSVLAYHTALELLGTAYTAMRTVYYLSREPQKTRKTLTWRGTTYRWVKPPVATLRATAAGTGVTSQERDRLTVLHTGRARTLVDCLDRLAFSGGLEEVLRSIEVWPTVDPTEVVQYLQVLGKSTLYAKVGYVLERCASQWGLAESDLEPLRKELPRSPTYLGRRDQPGRYVARWKLLIPTQLELPTRAS